MGKVNQLREDIYTTLKDIEGLPGLYGGQYPGFDNVPFCYITRDPPTLMTMLIGSSNVRLSEEGLKAIWEYERDHND